MIFAPGIRSCPRRIAVRTSTSEFAEPSNLQKASSSMIATGIIRPRIELFVQLKHSILMPDLSSIESASTRATLPLNAGRSRAVARSASAQRGRLDRAHDRGGVGCRLRPRAVLPRLDGILVFVAYPRSGHSSILLSALKTL